MIGRLHYISQGAKPSDHLQAIERACRAGVKWIQLRIKEASPEDVEVCAREAAGICDTYGAILIVNDSPQLACKVNAGGVHIGKKDTPPDEARKIVGDKMIIGGTANTIEDIERNISLGVDYIGVGPYRFTQTKKNLSPVLGLAGYEKIMRRFRKLEKQVPLIAIGGIQEEDVEALIDAGFHGVAISSAITHAADIQGAVERILEKLKVESKI